MRFSVLFIRTQSELIIDARQLIMQADFIRLIFNNREAHQVSKRHSKHLYDTTRLVGGLTGPEDKHETIHYCPFFPSSLCLDGIIT